MEDWKYSVGTYRYLEEDKDIYVTYNIQLICFVNEKKNGTHTLVSGFYGVRVL